MGVRAKGIPKGHRVARVNKVTPVSSRYPLSDFNKNSTLKQSKKRLRFASDGILCAAKLIGEIIAFEFD